MTRQVYEYRSFDMLVRKDIGDDALAKELMDFMNIRGSEGWLLQTPQCIFDYADKLMKFVIIGSRQIIDDIVVQESAVEPPKEEVDEDPVSLPPRAMRPNFN